MEYSVSMHPLVHAWAFDRMAALSDREGFWISAGCLMQSSAQYGLDIWLTQSRQLRPHLHYFIDEVRVPAMSSDPTTEHLINKILIRCLQVMMTMRDDAMVNELIARVFKRNNLNPDVVCFEWIDLYRIYGQLQVYLGRGRAGAHILQQVVTLWTQRVETTNRRLLQAQYCLGFALSRSKQTESAQSVLEHIIHVRRDVLLLVSEDDPLLLASQHELGVVLRFCGRATEAVVILEHVVNTRSRKLRPTHQDLIASQSQLAQAYAADKQITKSIDLFESVIAAGSQIWPEGNPEPLFHQYLLAQVYLDRIMWLDHADALAATVLLENVVRWLPQVIEEDQFWFQLYLGRIYLFFDNHTGHRPLLEHAVNLRKNMVTEEDRSLLFAQSCLAIAYLRENQNKAASELLEHVLKIGARTLAEDDLLLLLTQRHLARAQHWHCHDSKFTAARQLLEKVLSTSSNSLPEDHPIRLYSKFQLASISECSENPDRNTAEAIVLYQQIADAPADNFPKCHPLRLDSMAALAALREKKGDSDLAIVLYQQIIDAPADKYPEYRYPRLNSRFELANLYHRKGYFGSAIDLLEVLIETPVSDLPDDHPLRFESENSLAINLQSGGFKDEAISFLESLTLAREMTLPESNARRLFAQCYLGLAYCGNKEIEKGMRLLQSVTILGENHPDTVTRDQLHLHLESQFALAHAYEAVGRVDEAVELRARVTQAMDTMSEDARQDLQQDIRWILKRIRFEAPEQDFASKGRSNVKVKRAVKS
jgi:tetratricopeptide (TPR) repeat protein